MATMYVTVRTHKYRYRRGKSKVSLGPAGLLVNVKRVYFLTLEASLTYLLYDLWGVVLIGGGVVLKSF